MSMQHVGLRLMHALQGRRMPLIVATTVAVGIFGSVWIYWKKGGQQSARGIRHGGLGFPACEDPHWAMQLVLDTIRQGKIGTLGELVHFLRGPPAETWEGEKHPNAYRIRVSEDFIHFLQESYLPATRDVDKTAPETATNEAKAWNGSPVVERRMMLQLLAADRCLRCLEVERATPFDNHHHHHLNLLQQLWVAVGKPLPSYKRIGEHWGELGFQGEDPSTDLRGGGILALRQLVHFAKRHPLAIREMIAYNKKICEEGGESWYLTAVVSIQFTAQLLLQCDHRFYLPHLEVLYDTINLSGQAGKDVVEEGDVVTAVGDSSGEAKLVSRRSLAGSTRCRNTSLRKVRSPETIKIWTTEPASDGEAGMFLLHESLLLFFKECWERDKPHVMSYNTYVKSVVFPNFFTSSWAPRLGLSIS